MNNTSRVMVATVPEPPPTGVTSAYADTMTTVGDCLARFDKWFPPTLAEDWDAVGLVTGRRADPVSRVALSVDITAATVEWAIAEGAQLLFAHHPLYLRGTANVDGDSPKGSLVHRAISAGLAIHVAHTNADIARPGVSDAIAHALGLREPAPIRPHAADASLGLGRVGDLLEPCDLRMFVQRVYEALPASASGIRWAGDPERPIARVAICGGAGDDLLEELDADVYVTSDLRHHVASEYLASGRAALIDVPHAAAEAMFLEPLARGIRGVFPGIETSIYPVITDPWFGHSA